MAADLITEAVREPFLCEETFHLALTLFRKLAETSLEFLNLDNLAQQWGALLFSHTSREVQKPSLVHAVMLIPIQNIDHPENVDMIARGLTHLLHYATSLSKASQQPLSCRLAFSVSWSSFYHLLTFLSA